MKWLIHTLYLCFVILLTSCQNEIKQWTSIQNAELLIWTSSSDSNYTYEWEGASFDKLIHGSGILSIYNNGALKEKKDIKAYYGTIDEKKLNRLNDGSCYIGRTQDDLFSGFGVYIKGEDLYIGTFRESKPNGFLNWYKNGVLYYSGEWADGNFHGKGVLYKEDGTVKEGTWNNGELIQTHCEVKTDTGLYKGYVLSGKPDGMGLMQYNDSSCYKGEWKEGKWNGEGSFCSQTDSIIGNWDKGILNGTAEWRSERFTYNGDFFNNMPDGIGYINLSDSSFYEGGWMEGLRNGFGYMTFPNCDTYLGEWDDNKFNGIGTYTFKESGDCYEGEWKGGLQHGIGIYTSNNLEYAGNWEEGWINGKGRITYANKDFYEGEFVENELHGQGYYQFNNGNSYEGEFVDGKINGLGIFRFADGNVYEGEFQDGKIKGDGTLYYIEGKDTIVVTANWDGSNHFPKQASILFSNGDLYEGELVNGYPTENGVWSTEKERKSSEGTAYNSAKRANEFYKKHRNIWNKCVKYTSIALTVVEVAAPITGTILVATGVGAPAGAALITTGNIAGIANKTLIAADVAVATVSAGIDAYEAVQNGEDATEAITTLRTELAVNAVLIATPKVLKSMPARKAATLLSASAKSTRSIARKSSIVLSKNKVFGKTIQISKDQAGKLQKSLVKYKPIQTLKNLKSSAKKKFESTYLATKIAKTFIKKELDRIMSKGAIRLSKKEMEALNKDPKNTLRAFIRAKTGDKKNFQEFFIRLSMGDKKQVKQLLEIPEIRQYVDRAIRQSGEGGVHEWLMTKNFGDFLTNPKWGEDGGFLALALTKFVQRTNMVLFKGGGSHHHAGSGKFHIKLAQIIEQCSSKEELFIEIKLYAKEVLTIESYADFLLIFTNVFSTNA